MKTTWILIPVSCYLYARQGDTNLWVLKEKHKNNRVTEKNVWETLCYNICKVFQ